MRGLSSRPEIGSFIGMVAVLALFALLVGDTIYSAVGIKNTSAVVAQLGIIAIGACLLMIAGEFDLSIGSMIGFAGMVVALLLKYQPQLGPEVSILITFGVTLSIGWLIGMIVVKTRLPSFIVTLSFLFILRGLTEVGFRFFNGSTTISALPDNTKSNLVSYLFGGEFLTGAFTWLHNNGEWAWNTNRRGLQAVDGLSNVVAWWVVIALFAWWLLHKTRFGNWIYGAGGNPVAARSTGVPVDFVKVSLFMFSAFCATVYACYQVFEFNSARAADGFLTELSAIAAAVVGGSLLTGGYGTVAGVLFGAVILGFVKQGFFYLPWIEGSWFRVFVGTVLLAFVIINDKIRKKITGV